jgi:hypothetical protein
MGITCGYKVILILLIMYTNKDVVFIVTTACIYFVTRYFSNVISDSVYQDIGYNYKQDVDMHS